MSRARMEGKNLIVPLNATLARDQCILCGQHGGVTTEPETFANPARHPGHSVEDLLFRAALDAVLPSSAPRRVTLDLPLCGPCRRRWKSSVPLLIGVALLSLPIPLAGLYLVRPGMSDRTRLTIQIGFMLGWFLFLGIARLALYDRRRLVVTRMTASEVTFRHPRPWAVRLE